MPDGSGVNIPINITGNSKTDIAELAAQLKGLAPATQEAGAAAQASSGYFSNMGSSLLSMAGPLGALATGGGLLMLAGEGIKAMAGEAIANQTALVQMNAAIHSMGLEASISAPAIQTIDLHLASMSQFDHNELDLAATSLLRIQNIDPSNLKIALQSMMDLAAAGRGDILTNTQALGTMMETGLIPRAWAFDAALKSEIRSMITSGDTAGALNLVLGELSKRYGGDATANLQTFTGAWDRLWNTIKMGGGDVAAPTIDNLTGKVNEFYARVVAAQQGWGNFNNYVAQQQQIGQIAQTMANQVQGPPAPTSLIPQNIIPSPSMPVTGSVTAAITAQAQAEYIKQQQAIDAANQAGVVSTLNLDAATRGEASSMALAAQAAKIEAGAVDAAGGSSTNWLADSIKMTSQATTFAAKMQDLNSKLADQQSQLDTDIKNHGAFSTAVEKDQKAIEATKASVQDLQAANDKQTSDWIANYLKQAGASKDQQEKFAAAAGMVGSQSPLMQQYMEELTAKFFDGSLVARSYYQGVALLIDHINALDGLNVTAVINILVHGGIPNLDIGGLMDQSKLTRSGTSFVSKDVKGPGRAAGGLLGGPIMSVGEEGEEGVVKTDEGYLVIPHGAWEWFKKAGLHPTMQAREGNFYGSGSTATTLGGIAANISRAPAGGIVAYHGQGAAAPAGTATPQETAQIVQAAVAEQVTPLTTQTTATVSAVQKQTEESLRAQDASAKSAQVSSDQLLQAIQALTAKTVSFNQLYIAFKSAGQLSV